MHGGVSVVRDWRRGAYLRRSSWPALSAGAACFPGRVSACGWAALRAGVFLLPGLLSSWDLVAGVLIFSVCVVSLLRVCVPWCAGFRPPACFERWLWAGCLFVDGLRSYRVHVLFWACASVWLDGRVRGSFRDQRAVVPVVAGVCCGCLCWHVCRVVVGADHVSGRLLTSSHRQPCIFGHTHSITYQGT